MKLLLVVLVLTAGIACWRAPDTQSSQRPKVVTHLKVVRHRYCARGLCGGGERWAWRSLQNYRRAQAAERQLDAMRGKIARLRTLQVHAPARVTYSDDPRSIIRAVFGGYGEQAIAVATCESRLSPYARNGQYYGVFQMGSSERANYGDAADVRGQAEAAYRYFVASGSDWSPWECKP